MTLVERRRNQAYLEARAMLLSKGRALIIRPTGFGKTGILTRFIKEYTKNIKSNAIKVVYIYPSEVIRSAVLYFYYGTDSIKTIKNTAFLSYTMLGKMSTSQFKARFGEASLIIADEAHLLGGEQRKLGIVRLMEAAPNAHLLGATATPERSDTFDIIDSYFSGCMISSYTLHQAIQEGIIKKPYYVWCSYAVGDNEKIMKKFIEGFHNIEEGDRVKLQARLKHQLIEISRLQKMENVIRDTLDSQAPDTSYMRGIIYFSSFSNMHDRKKDVVGWFKKAYPDKKIRTMIVSSETAEYRNNAEKVTRLPRRENTIDLILSVDMLNMGYHVNNLTFIGMFRGTRSHIVYSQQLGRVLNSGISDTGIVFDFVDNLSKNSVFEILQKQKAGTINAKKELEVLIEKVIAAGGTPPSDIRGLTEEEETKFKKLWKRFKDNKGSNGGILVNQLEPEDLVVSKHEASYKEIIRKTVAVPYTYRCHLAWSRWRDAGGDMGDGSVTYVLGNAVPDKIPLLPFCYIYDVKVEDVLNIILTPERDIHKEVQDYIRVCKAAGIQPPGREREVQNG